MQPKDKNQDGFRSWLPNADFLLRNALVAGSLLVIGLVQRNNHHQLFMALGYAIGALIYWLGRCAWKHFHSATRGAGAR